jgi:hypothetical protein
MQANIKIYSALTALLSSDSERSTKRGRNLNLRFSPVLFWVFALTLSSCSKASNIGFEYGSIYSPSCTPAFQKTWHVGNIDYDWGLWGHNLGKALGTGLSEKAFAFDGKVRNHSQFCFSSDQLYQRLVDFILNAYGDGTQSPSRFVIMPNDNSIVCQCSLCKAAGNTKTSATPAVTQLIVRLARRFPLHTFFTSSYASVKEPPAQKMPDNVGVIISAMDLPYSAQFDGKTATAAFEQLINRWKKTVNKIYIWDYMRNFDDYLSPYPCLGILQKRLKWYRQKGVSGVILNGSGDDYAAFDDMQTTVIAQLLKNPDLDITSLVKNYYSENYPLSGKGIADYYLSLEKKAMQAKNGLPYYGGIGDEVAIYLNPTAFLEFDHQLDKVSKTITGTERHQLNQLLTGFNYTQLELIRAGIMTYDAENVATCLINLEGAKELRNMKVYREAYGKLSDYIDYYRKYPPKKQLPEGLTCSIQALTDGLEGSAYDYHTNWVISPRTTTSYFVSIHGNHPSLTVGCLQAPVWHIYAPVQIELLQDGKQKAVVNHPSDTRPQGESDFLHLSYIMPLTGIQPGKIELRLIAPAREDRVTVACDEIK